MIKEVEVKSTVIHWQEREMEITDTDGSKHIVPLNATIHVTMVGYPNREEKQMKAHLLGGYMSRGYIIEKIICEG